MGQGGLFFEVNVKFDLRMRDTVSHFLFVYVQLQGRRRMAMECLSWGAG